MSTSKVYDFLKREKMKALALAETLAQDRGSYTMFVGSYSQSREYNDIGSSIEAALRQQELWPEFVQAVDTKF